MYSFGHFLLHTMSNVFIIWRKYPYTRSIKKLFCDSSTLSERLLPKICLIRFDSLKTWKWMENKLPAPKKEGKANKLCSSSVSRLIWGWNSWSSWSFLCNRNICFRRLCYGEVRFLERHTCHHVLDIIHWVDDHYQYVKKNKQAVQIGTSSRSKAS